VRKGPTCKRGSFEVRFPDGRSSRYFYWDDIAGRRLRPDLVDSATAMREARLMARREQKRVGFPWLKRERPSATPLEDLSVHEGNVYPRYTTQLLLCFSGEALGL
jgi:hypothetical protein